ncbi:MAG: ribosome small subunit-dependent GTPase A [Clostridia bacterium]|nr:ribosome small subunit-dependent GTPase A [Clostridia bacterium]
MRETEGQGVILQGIGGFYTARDASGAEHILRAQGKLRRERMKPKVGDRVAFICGEGEEQGWISRVLPRKNALTRPPVANIDVMAVVVAAATPQPDLLLADRLMVNARRAGIDVQLVVNKCDLDGEQAREIARQYRGAGPEPILISAASGAGVEALRARLSGRICALAGQSGAGKSTTINALYGLDLETGDLSRKIERGRNTTRSCRLIPVAGGGMVLDTPGFSLLETDVFDPVELKDSYPELSALEGRCFFQPCYHASEPRCAVREAVARGEIDPRRHARYVELLEEMKQRWRDRYD